MEINTDGENDHMLDKSNKLTGYMLNSTEGNADTVYKRKSEKELN